MLSVSYTQHGGCFKLPKQMIELKESFTEESSFEGFEEPQQIQMFIWTQTLLFHSPRHARQTIQVQIHLQVIVSTNKTEGRTDIPKWIWSPKKKKKNQNTIFLHRHKGNYYYYYFGKCFTFAKQFVCRLEREGKRRHDNATLLGMWVQIWYLKSDA